MFSYEEHRAPCLALAEKVWVCDDRISPMPMKKASKEQLQVQRDPRAVLQRKTGDPNRHLSHTEQRCVGHRDKARCAKLIKPERTLKCVIHVHEGASILENRMSFFNLSTCIYTFWSCPSLTVIRLIGEDRRCFGHRLGLTIFYLKMCCGCVLQSCWPLTKKHNAIALLIKQCIVIHSMHEFSLHSTIHHHRWACKLIRGRFLLMHSLKTSWTLTAIPLLQPS